VFRRLLLNRPKPNRKANETMKLVDIQYSESEENLQCNLQSDVNNFDHDLDELVIGEATDGNDNEIIDAIDRPKRAKRTPAPSPQTLDADEVATVEALDVQSPLAPSHYRDMFERAKAEKKRRRTRNRVRLHRARPKETSWRKLATMLRKAMANPRGDKQLEQLRGREIELAGFRYLSRLAIAKYGPMPDAKLAVLIDMPRKRVWQLRQIVERLEAEDGPWHNL
jgi:hypothetical protein